MASFTRISSKDLVELEALIGVKCGKSSCGGVRSVNQRSEIPFGLYHA
jgi:hypothetical protein